MKIKGLNIIIMGCIGLCLEVSFRAITCSLVGLQGIKPGSLAGWTSLWMFVVYGWAGWSVGQINELRYTKHLKQIWQCLIGTAIILLFELVSGLILNVLLGLHLWDYSDKWGNIFGQICPEFALMWFFLCPVAIWLDDTINHVLYGEEELYHLVTAYKRLFTLK